MKLHITKYHERYCPFLSKLFGHSHVVYLLKIRKQLVGLLGRNQSRYLDLGSVHQKDKEEI